MRILRYFILSALILAAEIFTVWFFVMNSGMDSRQRGEAPEAVLSAPRMLVKGDRTPQGYIYIQTGGHFLEDIPFYGKSLWWGSVWWKPLKHYADSKDIYIQDSGGQHVQSSDELLPFVTREAPGEEVTGAAEIVPGGELYVAVFWREGANGIYEVSRIEADGSSEDHPRPGELRTNGLLETRADQYSIWAERKGDKFVPKPHAALWIVSEHQHDQIKFELSYKERAFFRKWGHRFADPEYVIELALLPKGKLHIVQVYIDGHPFEQGLEYMRRGEFPPHIPIGTRHVE